MKKLYTHSTYQNCIDLFIEDHQRLNPKSHYFDADTLKFFGEIRSKMKILKTLTDITDYSGDTHKCYILSSLQKRPNGKTIRHYAYFDIDTLKEINQINREE